MSLEWRTGQQLSDDELEELWDKYGRFYELRAKPTKHLPVRRSWLGEYWPALLLWTVYVGLICMACEKAWTR